MSKEKSEVEAAKGATEGQATRLSQEVERLRRRAQELENEVAKLSRIIDEAKLQESRLEEKARRLEVRVTYKTTDDIGNWTGHGERMTMCYYTHLFQVQEHFGNCSYLIFLQRNRGYG